MSTVSNNIKSLRKKHQYTQEQFAEKLGIKRSLLGAYEEARAKPRLEVLVKASELLGVSVDALVGKDIPQMEAFAEQPATSAPNGKSVTNSSGAKNMFKLVNKEKQAAYFAHRDDASYLQALPDMLLPTVQQADGTCRAFEVTDEAMLPMAAGAIVVGKKEENLQTVRSGQVYMVVTREEMTLRTVYNQVAGSGTLRLQAANPTYPDTVLSLLGKEVEMWEIVTYISQHLPDGSTASAWKTSDSQGVSLPQLTAMVRELQKKVEKLK